MNWKKLIGGAVLGATFAVFLAFSSAPAQAQINIGVQIGHPAPAGPPVCQWGYYDYGSYACAPQGYWGPEYFYRGVFVGVGPWFGWGYNHGWGGHRFKGYYRYQNHEWGNQRFRDREDHAGWRNDRARGEWHEQGKGWQRGEQRGEQHGEQRGDHEHGDRDHGDHDRR
ncbi:MAG: hypothetical protein P4M01_09090 [Acidobacteriota bacterium]|nr:hypothetical protein [Acidobacteriota bacterium]